MPKRRPAKKRSPAAAVLLAVLCLLLLAVSRYLDSRSEPAASVLAPEAAQADASGLEVHFLDIGQGDSALLFCGDETLLIDGGKVKNNQKLIARLKELEVDHLDAVICSHPDEDHCGGLSAVLASTRTDAFYCSVDSWHTKVSPTLQNMWSSRVFPSPFRRRETASLLARQAWNFWVPS